MDDKQKALDALERLYEHYTSTDGDLYISVHEDHETIRTALTVDASPRPLNEVKDSSGWQDISTLTDEHGRVFLWIDGDAEIGYKNHNRYYVRNNGDYADGGYGRDYECEEKPSEYFASFGIPTHWREITPPTTNEGEG